MYFGISKAASYPRLQHKNFSGVTEFMFCFCVCFESQLLWLIPFDRPLPESIVSFKREQPVKARTLKIYCGIESYQIIIEDRKMWWIKCII